MSLVLGIETSCDETAAAVVDDRRAILADIVRDQLDAHRDYGGVVPEIAARAHLEVIDRVVARAMDDAGIRFDALDGVAATGGPGLIGGVIVGVMTGKAIAAAHGLPFFAVNHLEAHVLTPRLTGEVDVPLSRPSGLRRALPVRRRRGGGAPPASRHHRRRCRGRGFRQGGQDAGARLSRRPGGRARGSGWRCETLRPAPSLARQGGVRFLLLGPQDRRPPCRRAPAARTARGG